MRQAHVADMNLIRMPLALVAGALVLAGWRKETGRGHACFPSCWTIWQDPTGPWRNTRVTCWRWSG
ncbi:hypothetical protein RAA17_20215 [Komagataeibacter rhaeticus]|nr:hypothetical protein [Komagataeibacter rhaeticus]